MYSQENPFIQQDDNIRRNMTPPRSYADFFFQLDCSPGMIMSDSEESSFSSCGTDEFFDFEDNISNALHLIDGWQKHSRRVRFGCTRVQEYAITVGDHPVCKDGLALSLDWSHSDEHVYNVDDFEQRRRRKSSRKGIRRRASKLDYWQRREILNRVGSYSNSELARIESERNRQAVSEFLVHGGLGEVGGPSEEVGVGVEQVYISTGSSSFCGLGEGEWQMRIQILEG